MKQCNICNISDCPHRGTTSVVCLIDKLPEPVGALSERILEFETVDHDKSIKKAVTEKTCEYCKHDDGTDDPCVKYKENKECFEAKELIKEQERCSFGFKVKRISDGKIFSIRKYIIDSDNKENVWSNEWYGHHVIGVDCEWCSQFQKENALLNKKDEEEQKCIKVLSNFVQNEIVPLNPTHVICVLQTIDKAILWYVEQLRNKLLSQQNTKIDWDKMREDWKHHFLNEKKYFDQTANACIYSFEWLKTEIEKQIK